MDTGAAHYTESINQPTKIRLADGSEVAITDWSWRHLYSTVDILSGATDEEFYTFNYVESDPVSHSSNIAAANQRNATNKDCNNEGKSQMPSEQEFMCYALTVRPSQFVMSADTEGEESYLSNVPGGSVPIIGNVQYAIDKFVWALEVTDKDFYTGDMSWFAAGGGVFSSATGGAAGVLRTFGNNGLASKEAIDRSPVPIHIGGTEEFKVIAYNSDGLPVTWQLDSGGDGDDVVMRFQTRMIGLQKRPAG